MEKHGADTVQVQGGNQYNIYLWVLLPQKAEVQLTGCSASKGKSHPSNTSQSKNPLIPRCGKGKPEPRSHYRKKPDI